MLVRLDLAGFIAAVEFRHHLLVGGFADIVGVFDFACRFWIFFLLIKISIKLVVHARKVYIPLLLVFSDDLVACRDLKDLLEALTVGRWWCTAETIVSDLFFFDPPINSPGGLVRISRNFISFADINCGVLVGAFFSSAVRRWKR